MPATTAILAFQPLRPHVVDLDAAPRHEARRGAVIGIAEVDQPPHVGRLGDRRDHRVTAIVVQGADQRIEAALLHGAGNLDFVADQPRQIDVEPAGWPSGPL